MQIYDHNSVHVNGSANEPRENKGAVWVKIIAVFACVLAFAAVILSCVTAPAQDGRDKVDAESTFEKVRSSVVEVYGASAQGSGIVYRIIGGKTYIITNEHVISGDTEARVRFTDFGTRYPATVLGYDSYHDIALLEADGDYGGVPVTDGGSVQNGTAVIAVGNNLGYGIAVFEGIVSQRSRILNVSSANKSVPVYAVTAALNPGMSGGGVFAVGGGIVGISTYQVTTVENVTRPVSDMNFCVPYSIAERIARAILERAQSGEQVDDLEFEDKIYVTADKSSYGKIIFTGLGFDAYMCADGFKVSFASAYPPVDLRGEIQEGDIVTRIGSLYVDTQTAFGDIFAECLKYKPDSRSGGAPLEIELRRGDGSVKVYYDRKILDYA